MSWVDAEAVDQFVDEMNDSAGRVGDTSVYLFNKFREGIGLVFILITTVAIAFIVAEFVFRFETKELWGINLYYLAGSVGLVFGAIIAYSAETAKIATIKGAVFSVGKNRLYQFLASAAVIAVLVLLNANGVQKIADFSMRYMDAELQNSYLIKIKEQKMNSHASVAKQSRGETVSSSSVLMSSRSDLIAAKNREIATIKEALDSYLKHTDPKAYRTMRMRKKEEASKKISQIERKWNKEISKMDWKIQKEQGRIGQMSLKAKELRAKEMKAADDAAKELEEFYKAENDKNRATVEEYKGIGLVIAISGEIIDGILALLLFALVKSNPNTNGTPKVDENTRGLRARVVAPARAVHTNRVSEVAPRTYPKKERRQSSPVVEADLSEDMFLEIKRVAREMAEHRDIYRDGYLDHPTQRELIAEFKDQGVRLTPREIQQYFSWMGAEVLFVNQRVGFVYAERIESLL
jgi:hypothetical protein